MATIKEDYVSFEVARLLKEKGFDEPCHLGYNKNGEYFPTNNRSNSQIVQPDFCFICCPTLQMAMKWLRKVYNLCLFVIPATIDETFRTGYALYPQCDSRYEWCASKNDRSKATFGFDINKKYCDSYEEACEAVIKYCLEYLI